MCHGYNLALETRKFARRSRNSSAAPPKAYPLCLSPTIEAARHPIFTWGACCLAVPFTPSQGVLTPSPHNFAVAGHEHQVYAVYPATPQAPTSVSLSQTSPRIITGWPVVQKIKKAPCEVKENSLIGIRAQGVFLCRLHTQSKAACSQDLMRAQATLSQAPSHRFTGHCPSLRLLSQFDRCSCYLMSGRRTASMADVYWS